MKFNSILALVYIFLICNSSILAVKEKVELCNPMIEEGKQIRIIPFLTALIKQAATSFTSDALKLFKEGIKLDQMTKPCKDNMKQRFGAIMDEIYVKEALESRVEEKMENLAKSVQELGKTEEEQEELADNVSNPRALCYTSVNILERQMADSLKWHEKSLKIQRIIDEILADPNCRDLKCLENKTHGWFRTRHTKTFLFHYVRDNTDESLSFEQRLEMAREVFKETNIQSQINKMAAEDTEVPNCRQLPDNNSDMSVCVQVGFATKVLAVWKMLTYSTEDEVALCFASFVGVDLIAYLLKFPFDKIVGLVVNLLALLIYKSIKVIYFAIKLFLYIKSAISETKDEDKKSGYWGQSVGTVFQIVFETFPK